MRKKVVIASVVCLLIPAWAVAERLPLLAVPEHYALTVAPDLHAETFSGEVRIRVRILQPTDHLVLHATELSIDEASVRAAGAEHAATVAPGSAETIRLQLPVRVAPGIAHVHLRYRGTLNRQLRGFYISEAKGRKYAVTQLEATDARRMFPSFDEPDLKATFSVTAIVDERDTAISNGPVVAVTPGLWAGKKAILFGDTPRMSTYLVALAVGDFECAPAAGHEPPLRVCATPGNAALTAFARKSAAASLRFMNDYFAVDYPFGKLDLVAIPDFAAGAMENTGAIFFRESLLLIDADSASEAARKRAALVIAHEIAHQWFGNLVTMRWWEDLWLNEGFATWMEVKAVRASHPEWHVEADEILSVQAAMGIDALPSTRAVRVMAQTPDEINELFDPIAYEKGAAVLRMIEGYVGPESFRGGVNAYLDLYAYDNAAADDFWRVMTRATHKPVDRIMQAFVTRPGIPVVALEATCRNGSTDVTLAQHRYLTAGTSTSGGGGERPWPLPVCLRYPSGNGEPETSCQLLDEPRKTISLSRCAPWVMANAAASGYFRTFYEPEAAVALARAGGLSAEERLSLAADETALLVAGRRSARDYLRMVEALAHGRRSPSVIETLAGGLAYMREYFAAPAPLQTQLETWVRNQWSSTPADTRGSDDRYEKARLALLGGVGRDQTVLQRARDTIERYLASQPGAAAPPDPTLLNTFVRLAASAGDRALYTRYRERSESAVTPEERYRFLYALADFREPELLRETFAYALSPNVRTQDASLLIARLLESPEGRSAVWPLIQERWDRLSAGLGAFGGTGRIIEALGRFCSREDAARIEQFFKSHPVPGAQRTLEQSLDRIQRCAAVAGQQARELAEALGT